MSSGKYQTSEGVVRFFKIGDFYEAFDADAETVRRELQLTITKRRERRMAGIPYHAIDRYVETLRSRGYKVEVLLCDD